MSPVDDLVSDFGSGGSRASSRPDGEIRWGTEQNPSEGAGKGFRALKAGIKGDISDGAIRLKGQLVSGPFQSQLLHKASDAHAHKLAELAVKVIAGKVRYLTQLVQSQITIQMLVDVVTYRQHTLLIALLCLIHSGP